MAKENPNEKMTPHKKQRHKASITDPQGGTTDVTRGHTHSQILTRRRHLKNEVLHSLTPQQRSKVLDHYHASAGRNDVSSQRLRHLKEDDKNRGTSTMTPLQLLSLQKRKKPNMALQRQMHRRETKRWENALAAADAEEILHTHTAGLVEAEHDMEKTVQLTQNQLKNDYLNESSARNIYELELNEYGPTIAPGGMPFWPEKGDTFP